MDDILVPTSPGELIDKLTILRLKTERITDAAKLDNVRREKETLERTATVIPASPALTDLWDQMYRINATLWAIEDDIRDCEKSQDFGPAFVALARAIYVTNDRRSAVKKQINLLLGSTLIEEKSYHDHGAP